MVDFFVLLVGKPFGLECLDFEGCFEGVEGVLQLTFGGRIRGVGLAIMFNRLDVLG